MSFFIKNTAMNQDDMKKAVAKAALDYVVKDSIIGVGTGSTANFFIDELANIKDSIKGTVASSKASADRLKNYGIKVYDLNDVDNIPVYIDGADEADNNLNLIKGGGGALTREKIIASASDKFICIADETKLVGVLGDFALPIEVIPMATNYVAKEIKKLTNSTAVLRKGFKTDNSNLILDIPNLKITNPKKLEIELNNIVGVVTNGLFANKNADVLLLGSSSSVKTITK